MKPENVRVLRRYLRAIEREVEYQLKAQTGCFGVTPAQCHALLELAELGETSLAELAEPLRLDTSTLSRTVDGLVKAGFINRIADPANRRSVRLSLTPEGRRRVDSIDKSCDQFYLHLLRHVPKSRQGAMLGFVKLLAEIFTSMRESGCCSANVAPGVARRRKSHGK